MEPLTEQDHVRGNARASLTLLQYGDYACAYCAEAHPIVQDLLRKLEGHVRFVYRHFPMSSPHRARRAAEAAEAAGAQGRFWEMHDLLSAESGAALDEERLFELAEALGLEEQAFSEALQSGVHKERVEADLQAGRRSGARGTPTFFVNGIRYDGELSAEALEETLGEAEPQQGVIAQAYMKRLGDIMGRAGTL